MEYPPNLQPTASEKLKLAPDHLVHVPEARPIFDSWSGPAVPEDYGGKPILDFRGEPMFAEPPSLANSWSLAGPASGSTPTGTSIEPDTGIQPASRPCR